jgi:hypothetical protein
MLRKSRLKGTAVLLSLVFSGYAVHAQSDEKKFEIGGQFSLLSLRTQSGTATTIPCVGPLPCPVTVTFADNRETEPGFGGRFGYNFTRYLALEAEGNFFPRDRELEGGRKTQGLFGVKVGKRMDRVGIFGKARPGFVRFQKGDLQPIGVCTATFPPPVSCFKTVGRTDFAFDVGGVVELYPTKHTIIRFDAGDTIIRFGNRNVIAEQFLPPGILSPTRLVVVPAAAETTHNFQGNIGFGFRF